MNIYSNVNIFVSIFTSNYHYYNLKQAASTKKLYYYENFQN